MDIERNLFLQMYDGRNDDNSFEIGNIMSSSIMEDTSVQACKFLQEKGYILLESCYKKKIGTAQAIMFKGKITEEGLKHIK